MGNLWHGFDPNRPYEKKMNILSTQKCGNKPLIPPNKSTIFNCNGKWCKVFIKIGGQKHLNKRKNAYELSHVKLIRSTMISVV